MRYWLGPTERLNADFETGISSRRLSENPLASGGLEPSSEASAVAAQRMSARSGSAEPVIDDQVWVYQRGPAGQVLPDGFAELLGGAGGAQGDLFAGVLRHFGLTRAELFADGEVHMLGVNGQGSAFALDSETLAAFVPGRSGSPEDLSGGFFG